MNKECNEKKKKQKFCATKMNVEWDALQASINNNSNNSTQQTAVHCFEAKYSLCVCLQTVEHSLQQRIVVVGQQQH